MQTVLKWSRPFANGKPFENGLGGLRNISDIGDTNDFGCCKWFSIHLVYKNIFVALLVYYYRQQLSHLFNSQRFRLLPSAPYLDRSVPESCLLYGGEVHNSFY